MLPLVAIMLVVLLVATAFALDLGMQRVVARDMQAVADLVALDMSRRLDGSPKSALQASPAWRDGLAASVARNNDALGDVETPDCPGGWTDPASGVCAEAGRLDQTGGFISIDDTEAPTAVRVTAAGSVAFAFAPAGGGPERGGATRSAIAQSEQGACFLIGSYAARLNTDTSPLLGQLLTALGSGVSLGVADYQGLVDTEIGLLDLLGANTAIGTVGALIEGDQLVSLAELYLATASALEAQSGRTAQVVLLEQLAATVGGIQLNAGDLLDLGTGAESGLGSSLNLFDLVTAAAAAATAHHGVHVPGASVNLGPLANVQTSLHITEALRQACGRPGASDAVATSTQAHVDLAANALNVNVGVLPGLAQARTNVGLAGSVGVAPSTGRLTDVRCGPPGITVGVDGGLLDVDLNLEIRVSAIVTILRVDVLRGPIRVTGQSTTSGDAVITIVDGNYDRGVTVGGGAGLPHLTVDTSGLRLLDLPLPIGPIANALVSGLVNPIIQGLDGVIAPLLEPLGLTLGGADVFARPTPQCGEPVLVG